MSSCWEAEPKQRIAVEQMKDTLNGMLKSGTDYGYLVVVPWEERRNTAESETPRVWVRTEFIIFEF